MAHLILLFGTHNAVPYLMTRCLTRATLLTQRSYTDPTLSQYYESQHSQEIADTLLRRTNGSIALIKAD